MHKQSYVVGTALNRIEDYNLALSYLHEKNFCDPDWFDRSMDCYYLDNYGKTNIMIDKKMYRPSYCSKFVLRGVAEYLGDIGWVTTYHGTDPSNARSILK